MKKLLNRAANSVWHGLIIGLLIPGIFSSVAWYLIHYVQGLSKADLLYIASIAVNALLMQYYFKRDKENTGKGILSATFICAFVFYFYKVL